MYMCMCVYCISSKASPVWVDGITCSKSESCFSTDCIDDPSEVTSGPCANHEMDVSISCSKYIQYHIIMYF